MSSGAQQLQDDFEQVQKLLETYPDIKIINTEGDPPEQYDIEYTIKGYKTNPDGTTTPDNSHEVRIILPFGYPHFPPTAKPITPIFHPDIDPDAIRIADFWQENHSLPDLIIHIGQMICGNHYTKDEPFNQSAFEWFEERKSWLPFDILEPREEDDDEEAEAAITETSDVEAQQAFSPATDLDILKDDIDFPFDDDEDAEDDGVTAQETDEPATDPDILKDDIDSLFDEDEDAEDGFAFSIEEDSKTDDVTAQETDGLATDLDILKDDIDFPFDDDEAAEDGFALSIEEDSETDDVTAQTTDEPTDEISLDIEADESVEPSDLLEAGEDEIEDLFTLEADEIDDFSFDLSEEPDETPPVDDTAPAEDLFDLESEATVEEGEEETPLEFDSEDISSAFEEEGTESPEVSEAVDIALDDLAGLDEEEDALDFGIDEESLDLEGAASADLSGLEEETGDEIEPESDTTSDDEEKILSAIGLGDDFAPANRPEDQSKVIRSLIEHKQIFSAKKIFSELPDPGSLPDKNELELTITDAVSEAEDLYKKADKHEQKGEFEKAGIILDLIANIAIDFPGLDFSRNRIRESMMSDGKKKKDGSGEDKKAERAKEDVAETSVQKPEKKKTRAKFSFKIPARLIYILFAVIIFGGLGAGGAFVYNNDSGNIQLASKSFQKAEQFVKSKEFKDAQKQLDAAKTALNKILILQGPQKEALTTKISSLTDSSLFKEGLQGRVLYGDTFVSIETAKAIDKFNTQISYAEQVQVAGKLDQAISAYEKSLPYAEKAGFEEQIKTINRKINELRLEITLAQAKQSEDAQDWLNAEKAYQGAMELSKTISSQEVQSDIAKRSAVASYRYNLQEGLKAVNDSQWQESIDAFQAVQKVLEASPQIVPETEATNINKLLIQSHLYFALSKARKAYENKDWKVALDTYNDAVALLETNANLFGQESKDNIKKIEKTILTTHVAREQVHVATTKADNDLEKTVEHYEAIATMIEDSAFKDDETLAQILDDARKNTTEIKNQLLISKREEWLTENFETIFRDNYPSAEQSELLNPKVRFIKRDGNIMIFNISCTERKQGRTFRLELNYQYDLDKDKWSLYSGNIEEE